MKNVLLERKIEKVSKKSSFCDIFNDVYTKYSLDNQFDAIRVEKRVRVSEDGNDWYDIDIDNTVSDALEVIPHTRRIQFCCDKREGDEEVAPSCSRTLNDVLMKHDRRELNPMKENNNKHRLHNKVLIDLQRDAGGKLLTKPVFNLSIKINN